MKASIQCPSFPLCSAVLLGIRNAIDAARIKGVFIFLVTVDRDWGGLDVGHNVCLLNREGEAGWCPGNIFQVEKNLAILYDCLHYLATVFKL